MKRRKFLKTTTAVGGAAALGLWKPQSGAAMPENPNRPNLLFIMTDQQFGDLIGGLGRTPDPLGFATPHLDRLLANGRFFDRAYATQPLCVPCRNSIITGRYPHETGVVHNRSAEPGSVPMPMMGTYLTEAGYDCGYVGKWHLAVPDSDTVSHGFPFVRYAEGNRIDKFVAPGCSEFFDQWDEENPFFLVASWVNPHDICEVARIEGGGDDRLPNGEIGSPPDDPAQLPPLRANHALTDDEPPALRKVRFHPLMKNKIYPTEHYTEKNWRRYMWAYHRLVEKVDAQIGELLADLDRRGLTDNTVIVFTSDHGEGYGSHHLNQKQCFYEEVARVPFVVSGPGISGRGTVDNEHLVSIGLDILPTLLDFAGAEVPAHLPGKSVKSVIAQPDGPWRDACVLQTEFGAWGPDNQTGIKGRCVLTGDYKYIRYVDPEDPNEPLNEQLFHRASDPGEMRNLIRDPGHQQTVAQHLQILREYAETVSDPFPVS